MKIKQEKQMTLPQLIEYAWENDIKNERYRCSDINTGGYVWINENSDIELDEDMCISKDNRFTVTTEEEITEDTEFKELVCLDSDGEYDHYDNVSVSGFVICAVKAIYIPNDDFTLTLIWTKEKGMKCN